MDSTREKVSYCIGLETGKNLKNQFDDLDTALLLQGFQDALHGNAPQLAKEEVQRVLAALKQQIEKQQREFVAKMAQDNKRAGDAFLAENRRKEGVVTLPSGLQYQVLKTGSGPSPTLMDQVSCHYHGTFVDGHVFDSSYARGEPYTFPVNRVIPGWAEALQLMKVGDKWRLFIPAYLAYGEMGFANQIPPNMALIFDMELVSIS
jgi:FKBP-type peptidyl-prolyl cis-trans isomerase FklB